MSSTAPAADELLEAALQWTALCRVVPCRGKNPGGYLGAGWQSKASRDAPIVCGWWRRWQAANIGIVPGRDLLPIDVDRPAEWETFQRTYGSAPPTPIYLTGGEPGRVRLILAHPGGELRDHLCPGVQLRDGERVSIVPPGVNPDSGGRYEWIAAPDELPIAAMPQAWLEQAHRPAGENPVRTATEWRGLVNGRVQPGDRHDTLLALAGYLVARLRDGRLALELLQGWNVRHCKPPKAEEEIAAIVKWVLEQEVKRWGADG